MERKNKPKLTLELLQIIERRKKNRPKRTIWFYVVCLVCFISMAYFYQWLWLAMESKGGGASDRAWEELAHETFSRQYQGVTPQMRVAYGSRRHDLCGFWNFEALWGNCKRVRIVTFVRDYRLEYRPVVEREVEKLANSLRRPCVLLSELNLSNEQELRKQIGCSNGNSFKFDIAVTDVQVTNEQLRTDPRSQRWSITWGKYLYTTHFFDGEM